MKYVLALLGVLYILGLIGCAVLAVKALFDAEYLRALAFMSVLIFDVLTDIRLNTKSMKIRL